MGALFDLQSLTLHFPYQYVPRWTIPCQSNLCSQPVMFARISTRGFGLYSDFRLVKIQYNKLVPWIRPVLLLL